MVDLSQQLPLPDPESFEAEAVFLCVRKNGNWVALLTVPDHIVTERESTQDDLYHAVTSIKRDIEAAHQAQATVMLHHQTMAQLADRAQNQRIAQDLFKK